MENQNTYVNGSVPYKINLVREIKRTSIDSSLIDIMVLERGEIELRVTDRQLDIYSRNKNGTVTHTISKRLVDYITPREAINNAERSIFHRLSVLETNRREIEMREGLVSYLSSSGLLFGKKQLFEKFRRAKDSGELSPEVMKQIMTAFEEREKEKVPA